MLELTEISSAWFDDIDTEEKGEHLDEDGVHKPKSSWCVPRRNNLMVLVVSSIQISRKSSHFISPSIL
jgi:hypothetical protein